MIGINADEVLVIIIDGLDRLLLFAVEIDLVRDDSVIAGVICPLTKKIVPVISNEYIMSLSNK
ncbi:MAG TPA: hypothetical protein VMV81_06765, partial [Phycisphaerae bacterium]|nr:hypothetical protein [Phycisphaerae bacterium]